MDLDITLVGADVPAPAPVLHQDGTSRDSDRCAWIWDLPNNGREGAPVSRRADPDSAAGGTRQSVTGEGKEEPAVDVFLAPATSAVAVQLADLLRARGLAVDLYHPVAVTRYGTSTVSGTGCNRRRPLLSFWRARGRRGCAPAMTSPGRKIGRASCRERV